MCFTSAIASCFEVPHPFVHPMKTLKEGFIGSYQHIYAEIPVRQCWFLFNLYGYSKLLVPIFDKYHPKYGNSKSWEQNNYESGSQFWFLKYMRRLIVLPRNHKDFSYLVSKLIIGRMKIVIFPGFVITAIELLLISSFPKDKFCFWKDFFHHALFIFV